MGYLIDTSIAIHARDGTESVLDKLTAHDGSVMLSALSLAELERGVGKVLANAALRRLRLDLLVRHMPVLPFDAAAAMAYGRMIAGHALSVPAILVTDNISDFHDIPGLVVENWASRPAAPPTPR